MLKKIFINSPACRNRNFVLGLLCFAFQNTENGPSTCFDWSCFPKSKTLKRSNDQKPETKGFSPSCLSVYPIVVLSSFCLFVYLSECCFPWTKLSKRTTRHNTAQHSTAWRSPSRPNTDADRQHLESIQSFSIKNLWLSKQDHDGATGNSSTSARSGRWGG